MRRRVLGCAGKDGAEPGPVRSAAVHHPRALSLAFNLEADDVYRIDGPLDVPALLPAANRLEARSPMTSPSCAAGAEHSKFLA